MTVYFDYKIPTRYPSQHELIEWHKTYSLLAVSVHGSATNDAAVEFYKDEVSLSFCHIESPLLDAWALNTVEVCSMKKSSTSMWLYTISVATGWEWQMEATAPNRLQTRSWGLRKSNEKHARRYWGGVLPLLAGSGFHCTVHVMYITWTLFTRS